MHLVCDIIITMMYKERGKRMVAACDNLKDVAYKYIKQQILDCEFIPGQKIYEKQIAEKMDIGRTPVREALIRLENENLVEIFPRKGMCTKQITRTDVMELFQIRKILEPTVAVKYKRHIDKNILLEYEDKFHSFLTPTESDAKFYSTDIAFHIFIMESTENTTLINFYKSMMQTQYRIGIYSVMQNHNNIRSKTVEEHSQMIKAILLEDDEKIEKTVLSHINSSLISALETI